MGSLLEQSLWTGRLGSPGHEANTIANTCKVLEEDINTATEAPSLALDIMQSSGGTFNLWLGTLVKLWNIDSKDGSPPYVPTQEEIGEALRKRELDLGAYGKGAACDAALRILMEQSYSVPAAVINLGGNILTYGRKPWGQPFKIALRDPKGGPNDTIGMFTLKGTHFISTSGSYEKYFERDGKRYHHIFDPETGYPAEREPGLISVTVINDNGAVGDALSTACFVLGYAGSQEVLQTYGCDAIFICENGTVRATGGVRDYFTLTSSSYHWYDGVGA